jgi:hypothetical protein
VDKSVAARPARAVLAGAGFRGAPPSAGGAASISVTAIGDLLLHRSTWTWGGDEDAAGPIPRAVRYDVGMPRRNRVSPLGDLIADPARGLVYGNRGCLHDAAGRIRRGHAGRRWIACRLRFRGWHRGPLLQPGRFTELFFLDEATALAAGHRPCALCRRADYDHFRALVGEPGADAIDARLHAERLDGRARRLHAAPARSLPDGAFVLRAGAPWLVRGDGLLRWTPAGYAERVARPAGDAVLVTPPTLVRVLRAGWEPAVPLLHPSAGVSAGACDRPPAGDPR